MKPNKLMERRFGVLACLFVAALALAGCIFPSDASPLSLVPANASSVSIANVGALATDADVRALYRAMSAGREIDVQFARIASIGNVSVRDAGEAVSFSLGPGNGKDAAIIRSSRSETDFQATLSSAGWLEREFDGKTYYFASRNSTAAAFANGNVVVGGEEAVKSVIAVAAGAESVEKNARIQGVLAKLPSGSLIRSASTAVSIGSLEVSPFNYSSVFSTASASGFSFVRNGENAEITLAVMYSTPNAAIPAQRSAEQAISSLRSHAKPGGALSALLSAVSCANEEEFVICRESGEFASLEESAAEWQASMSEQP